MRIRAIAIALPALAVGIACGTTRSERSSTRTASAERPSDAGQPSADRQSRGAAGPTEQGTREPDAAVAGELPSSGGSGETYGSAGTSGSTADAGDVRAHSVDQVVSGRLAEVSSRAVTVATRDGQRKKLKIVPQTVVQVDGRAAQASDLEEGQPVRASFAEQSGDSVAVEIHAGRGADTSGSSGAETGSPRLH